MFTFKITPDDGEPFEVCADSRDVARWEAGGKDRSVGRIHRDLHMGDLYDVAFVACVRLDRYDGDIRQFRKSVVLKLLKDEDEEPDPTQPAP